MIYLRLKYELPHPGDEDYIGPFASFTDAINHKKFYGPIKAVVVDRRTPPDQRPGFVRKGLVYQRTH